MVDAVVGVVIAFIATTSLLASVEVIEKAYSDASRQELSSEEHDLLDRSGLDTNVERLQFWQDNLRDLPKDVVSGSI